MKNKGLIIIIFLYLVVIGRVIYLNSNNSYAISDDTILGLTAPRGRILDINGNVLVDNIGVKSLIFNKLNLSTLDTIDVAKKLSNMIDIKGDVSDYYLRYYYYINNKDYVDGLVSSNTIDLYNKRKISSKDLLENKLYLISVDLLNSVNKKEAYIYYLLTNGYSYADKIIKTNLTDEEYLLINNSNLKGIRTDITWERYYPYGNILKDVFGSISSYKTGIPYELKDYYLDKGYNLSDRVGVNNLEYIYDDYLKGKKATYKLDNGYLTKISDYQKGKDIVISIDINMQMEIEKIMEEEMLKAKSEYNTKYYDTSYLVVSNPNTGEIISLVGKKLGENNNFVDYSYFNAINSFTIGSAVKGASISVGYKYGIIDEKTKVKDSCVVLKNQRPKCSWKTLGYLDDIEALRMSSNYFQYLIAVGVTGNKYKSGIRLNANKEHFEMYRNVFSEYGLGNITGIDLSNESTGIKGYTISDDLLLNFSIGQYDTYTPLELSQYINTVATGYRVQLSLLKYVLNDDGSIFYEKNNKIYNKVPIDDYYLDRIRKGLYEVNKSGTGYSYTNHKFSSAGKTGTAETMLGNINTVSTSYVMYAPFESPKFSIVMVSPNIKYQNKVSSYKYPINAKINKRVSDIVYNEIVKDIQ